MTEKKKIAVLFGGCSEEYDVSIHSAGAVISSLSKSRYTLYPIGITRDGAWLHYMGDPKWIESDEWHKRSDECIPAMISPDRSVRGVMEFDENGYQITKLDAVFPVLHGKNGEDGTLQGLVEMAGIPLVGCGTFSSALCMDKDKSHRLVELAGVPCAKSRIFSRKESLDELQARVKGLIFPLYVKPVRSGSSIGITKVYEPESLEEAAKAALEWDDEIILEENVEGTEVGCAILGNHKLIVGEADEIELMVDWFDYHEKYSQQYSRIHTPGRFDQEIRRRIRETALVVYRVLGCSGYARIDLFLTPDGRIFFNEVNTIPGLTDKSRFPKMMKGAGYEFADLLEKLVDLSMEK